MLFDSYLREDKVENSNDVRFHRCYLVRVIGSSLGMLVFYCLEHH